MTFEYFIARGMSRSVDGRRPNIMVRLAGVSVALGVAVMIVTSAVIAGFGREIERRLTGFTAHVRVSALGGFGSGSGDSEPEPFARSPYAERLIRLTEGFVSADSYLLKSGMVRGEDTVEGLLLKGYDGDGGAFFGECLVEGAMPRTGDSVRYKDILLSRTTAERLNVAPGDKIEMLFVEGGSTPRRDRFTVSGIYSSGMDETDRLLALTDIRNIRRIVDRGDDAVSGYEVMVGSLADADAYADRLNERILFAEGIDLPLGAQSLHELYPAIFDWQKTHDVNAAVIFVLMLTVALFNTVSALLILVLERTRTVGVLKALGTDDSSLRKIFLWRAAFIVVRGVAWGDIAGIALCLLQKYTHLVRLDPEGYILSEMPVHLEWWHVAAIDAGAAAAIILGLSIPARIVASIRPDEAVRYE